MKNSKKKPKKRNRKKVEWSHLKRVGKVRIYPNKLQILLMTHILFVCMTLYNAALLARKLAYEKWAVDRIGKYFGPNFSCQCFQTTQLRHDKEFPAFASIFSEVLAYVLRHVNNTFNNYLDRIEANKFLPNNKQKKVNFPRTKTIARYRTFTFSHGGRNESLGKSGSIKIKRDTKKVRIPGVGWIPYRNGELGFPTDFTVVHVTCKNEKWYIFADYLAEQGFSPHYGQNLANDGGVVNISASSDGDFVPNPRFGMKFAKKIARWKQSVDRCMPGSRQFKESTLILARLQEKIANCRENYAHEQSRKTAQKPYDVFVHEDLDVDELVMKKNKPIEGSRKVGCMA